MRFFLLWVSLNILGQLTNAKKSTGLLLAGGNSINPAQFWTKDSGSCALPPLLSSDSGHTVDLVSNTLVDCHGRRCNQLTPQNGWEEVVVLVEPRLGHTSAVLDDDLLLLVGGRDSPETTEMVDLAKGKSMISFSVQPGRRFHCSTQLTSDTIVLTGGLGTETIVSEISNLREPEPSLKDLPSLQQGRHAHACGSYEVADSVFLLVTGGTNSLQHLASTEVKKPQRTSQKLCRCLNTPPAPGAMSASFQPPGSFLFF